MTRLLKTLAAGTMLAASLAAAPALALDDAQKKEMGEFIREYLLENPEIMLEVQSALEAKQQSQRMAMAGEAVAANHDAIFSSKDGMWSFS